MCSNAVAFCDTMSPIENIQATEELPRGKQHLVKCLHRVRNIFHKKQKVISTNLAALLCLLMSTRLPYQSTGTAFR